jgi:DNA-binding IscR family transcriptional regulator
VNQPYGQAAVLGKVDGPIAMLPCVSLNYYASCDECDEETCQIKNVFEKVRDKTLKVLTTTSIDSMRQKI